MENKWDGQHVHVKNLYTSQGKKPNILRSRAWTVYIYTYIAQSPNPTHLKHRSLVVARFELPANLFWPLESWYTPGGSWAGWLVLMLEGTHYMLLGHRLFSLQNFLVSLSSLAHCSTQIWKDYWIEQSVVSVTEFQGSCPSRTAVSIPRFKIIQSSSRKTVQDPLQTITST